MRARTQQRSRVVPESTDPTTRMQDAGFQAQRFLSTRAATYNTFNVQRHLISARTHRAFRASVMNMWREAVAVVLKYSGRRILVFLFQRCDNAVFTYLHPSGGTRPRICKVARRQGSGRKGAESFPRAAS